MPEVFKTSIIKLLKHADYKPLKPSQLAKALNVSPSVLGQFKAAVEQLRQAGHIIIGSKNMITLPPLAGRIIGTFRANPKGFGFVIPRDPMAGDLFIPPDATQGTMTGDIVAARVVKKGKRLGQMRYSGKIVEILQRGQSQFVGTLLKTAQGWIVQPDGRGFAEPIAVSDVSAKRASKKDKVVVEIISYPSEKAIAFGVITEVLGKAANYETEIQSIIRQFRLPGEFEQDCLNQSRQAAADFNPDKIDGREDITDKVIITIDPADSKDFDDAISIEKDENGNRVLGIHIADVSHFVGPTSPLDSETKIRGNSVYLPGKTIPMLPEILSNGICSLQPSQKRFVKSAYITYDKNGNILSRRFANSLICSTQRLTYRQADKALKGSTKGIKPEVVELLKNAENLSRTIESRRIKNGTLHLDLPETELVLDKSGRVVDAHPADTSYPHTIIEMFMVEANEAVASLLDKLNISFMRRIHPEPNSLSMKNLSKLVRVFGLTLPRKPQRHDLQRLLWAVKNTDSELVINLLVLRSMEKAQYAPLHIGHFALASTNYCHFTSPIRRYADLLVHRLLQCYLEKSLDSSGEQTVLDTQDLAEIGKHIGFTEQQAEDAESELKIVLILQMLSNHLGDRLDCVVTGLAGFGVFAKSKKYGIEGLIKTEDLGPDKWDYLPKAQRITGLESNVTIHLGQAIKTKIMSINVGARQMNLIPAEPLIKTNRRPKKNVRPRTRRRKGRK